MTSINLEFDGAGEVTELGDGLSAFEAPEITPEEYAEHLANLTANALAATKMIKIIEVRSGLGQVHILGRIRHDRERKFLEDVVDPVLRLFSRNEDGHGFIGKQFVLKDDKVKYAWVLSFAANDLKKMVSEVCRSFDSAVPRMEVTEAPLLGPGAPQSGGQKTGRKGATPIM